MIWGWRAVKWIHNCGFFYEHGAIWKHCGGNGYVFVAHLTNVVLSLLIPSSMLPQMLVCLPRYKRVNAVWFLTYELQEQAKVIHSGRRIGNSDCMCTWKEVKKTFFFFFADRDILYLTLNGGYRDIYICQNLSEKLKSVHFIAY